MKTSILAPAPTPTAMVNDLPYTYKGNRMALSLFFLVCLFVCLLRFFYFYYERELYVYGIFRYTGGLLMGFRGLSNDIWGLFNGFWNLFIFIIYYERNNPYTDYSGILEVF
jgi:hypothetical protein